MIIAGNAPAKPGELRFGPDGVMEMPAQTAGDFGNSSSQAPNALGANFSVELPSDDVRHAAVEKGEMTPQVKDQPAADKPGPPSRG